MSPWCRCRIGRQAGSHGRLLVSMARRVGVNAGLGAGRRLYWIGGRGYKPKACRILLTEKNRETKLLSDRPRLGVWPVVARAQKMNAVGLDRKLANC
jgi:hypothetical protein